MNNFKFTKYSEIENVYRTKEINTIIEQGKSNGLWVVNEKIHGCLTFDAIVETKEFGKLPIGEIIRKKLKCNVKSYNLEKDIIEFKPINGYSIKEDNNDWYELEFENGQKIIITGSHYIWLPKLKVWRKVEDLIEKDLVLLCEKVHNM